MSSPVSPPWDGAALSRPARPLLIAWLLLLLDQNESHGYDLRRALGVRDLHADQSTVYRTLRDMERDGWVRSRWCEPCGGPRQRRYTLTAEGRRVLDAHVAASIHTRDLHDALVRAHEDLRAASKRPPGSPAPKLDVVVGIPPNRRPLA